MHINKISSGYFGALHSQELWRNHRFFGLP